MNEPKVILHHYDISPSAGKVRSILGIKQVRWFACNQPGLMPKDDLIALTGGYRRIPVLQIGADLFFDSGLITRELERLFPEPSVFDGSGPGLGIGFAYWTDSVLMTIAGLLYGGDRDSTPEYRADRSALLGVNFDVEAMERAWPANSEKLRLHLALLEQQLADGRAFLTGSRPDIVDASFYGLIEYMYCGKGKTSALLAHFPGIEPWVERMRLIGDGEHMEISRAETVEIARISVPSDALEKSVRLPHEPKPGDSVKVKYYDNNSPVLYGILQHISPYKISVRREHHGVGPIVLHMPRTIGQVSRNES
jgi:glutathione S-transferase